MHISLAEHCVESLFESQAAMWDFSIRLDGFSSVVRPFQIITLHLDIVKMVHQHEIEDKCVLNDVPFLTFSNFLNCFKTITPITSLAV